MKSEPVITASAIVGVVMSFLLMLVALGVIKLDDSQMGTIQAFLVALAPLVLTLIGAFWARSRVTPTAAPKTKDGAPAVIVPQAQFQAMQAELPQASPYASHSPE